MRRILSFVLVALLATSLAPATPSGAAGSFTFYGSGFGHGLGMSQWGAFGLARAGWGHRRILTHFYAGTKVEPGTIPPRIRIGLTYDRTLVHLTAKHGPVRLWIGAPLTGRFVGKIRWRKTWTVRATDEGYAIRDGAGRLVGGKTWGGPSFDLYATYADVGARVFIPEADAIWDRGFQYSRGHVEFNLYGCGTARGCRERLIIILGVEEYLYGLAEVSDRWPMEAMAAQATAARTYALYAMRHYGRRRYCNCHLTDGTIDQTYIGYGRESQDFGARWVAAVDETAGEVITYKGALIQSFYAASDGGHSENVEDVWHGGNPAYAIPWLTGVCDPGEYTSTNPWTDWQRSFSADDLTSRLGPYTGNIGTVEGFARIRRGVSGRVITMVARGTQGQAVVSGTQLKAALGLWDDRVWINADRNVLGRIRTEYDDLMCAPGLPTSVRRAVSGGSRQKFEVGGIFRNDRVDRTVWLKGALYGEYMTVGGATGTLGLPTTNVVDLSGRRLSCSGCSRVSFAGGRIYRKAAIGAHALWGRVLTAYLRAGGSGGALGFPTSRARRNDLGTWSASFEHGTVSCPQDQSCVVTSA